MVVQTSFSLSPFPNHLSSSQNISLKNFKNLEQQNQACYIRNTCVHSARESWPPKQINNQTSFHLFLRQFILLPKLRNSTPSEIWWKCVYIIAKFGWFCFWKRYGCVILIILLCNKRERGKNSCVENIKARLGLWFTNGGVQNSQKSLKHVC